MIRTFNMLGAAATPFPYGELYSALQQGVVDAGEGPVQSYWAMKHYEVAKYFSYTDTFISPALPMVGLKWFNAQPKEFRQAIEQAAKETAVKERQLMADQEKEATADLKSKGVQFNELKDKEAFMKMVEPIHKEYEARLGKDLLDKARRSQVAIVSRSRRKRVAPFLPGPPLFTIGFSANAARRWCYPRPQMLCTDWLGIADGVVAGDNTRRHDRPGLSYGDLSIFPPGPDQLG